ncbi:unnamed protein product [Mytilus coruscus]|uniref:SGNH hydrolase-type esterase domain-containing protein n=1 Tax=Mytilus coruscus TaxID=42192 RepID=A0A6J8EJ78_MYTCO|nr:unnamed protein product [Mytilus coruscus]
MLELLLVLYNIKSYAGVRNQTLRNENSRHSDTYDLLIIGSSIIKDLDGKRMYKHRKVKITTLHDKTVFGAIQYIKSFRDKAKHIMFQIGSNDIEQKTPDEVIQEIEELVRVTRRYNPDATITFGEILPRFLSGRYYAKFFNEHRLIFNVQLYELCKDLDLHFVRNGQIVLIGDLNARTGQRADYIVNDSDHINNFDGFDLLPENYITDSEIKRNNQDTSVNTVGTKLLDMCLSSRLRLLNGRFLGDSLGYYTYMSSNGFSTVDYAVVIESLLSSVK